VKRACRHHAYTPSINSIFPEVSEKSAVLAHAMFFLLPLFFSLDERFGIEHKSFEFGKIAEKVEEGRRGVSGGN
jgi:hypothetical protein